MPGTLYDKELKPFSSTRMMLAILGALPCTWKQPHDTSLHPVRSTFLYCMLLYSAVSYSVFELMTIMVHRLSRGQQLSTVERIFAIDSIAMMFPHLIVLMVWVEGKALWAGVRAWALLKIQYQRVAGTKLVNKRRLLERLIDFIMIAMPSSFSILLALVDDPEVGVSCVPAYVYGNMVQLGLLLLWIGYFTSIGDVAEDISTEFQKHLSDGQMCADMVNEYRKLWVALRTVPDIMEKCSVPLIIMINIILLSSVLIYNSLTLIWEGYFLAASAHILVSVAYLTELFFVSVMSGRTNDQMNSLFSGVLAPVSLGEFDSGTQREILKFFLVEQARPAASSFSGFIVVDKHMFISMLTAITEYIIVFAQFNSASQRRRLAVERSA